MRYEIPVMLLKRLVILPNQEIKIDLNNSISKQVIKEASLKSDGKLLVVAPMDTLEEEPSIEDLPKVGVVAKIKNKIAISEDSVRLTLRGLYRVAVKRYYFSKQDNNILNSEIFKIDLPKYNPNEEIAVRRKLIELLEKYIASSSDVSNSIISSVKEVKDLNTMTDIITSFLPFNIEKKLEYMQNINPLNRAISLINDIKGEIEFNEIDNALDDRVHDEIIENQKEFLLKEKLKAIKNELGETSLQEEDAKNFRELLDKLKINKEIKEKLSHEIDKYELMNYSSPELSVLRNYLDWTLNLPWNKLSKEENNFNLVQVKLDETHYGLQEIKERIIEYIAVKNLNPKIKSPILCLVGPPGVGKTSIAMSIASALNRKFYKISVGGLNDSTELIGTRRTYLAASPGRIIQGLKKCGTRNPLILIDEIDKMVKDYKGDPAATLLEILDPVQNQLFTDNYIEEPFNLSNVLFILTANNIQDIPLALLDRVEVIELNSYTIFEKKDIARKYLLPQIYREHLVNAEDNIKISDEVLYYLINSYTDESGVRDLERVLTSLVRKLIINNIKTVNNEKISKLLGSPKYNLNEEVIFDTPGVANILAIKNAGGIVTKVELVKYKGTGQIITTGMLEKVMEESIKVAVSYVKNKYNHLLNNIDLHFHFLSASIPKDGPSAGVSITSALISLLEKKQIPEDVAFTGEISLNGNILKIGKLKEKIIGAYNKGIKVVYIPRSNVDDLKSIPKIILENMTIIMVTNYQQIYLDLFK